MPVVPTIEEVANPTPGTGPVSAMVEAMRPMLSELLERQHAQQLSANLELVGQLKPGKNVRVLPADEVDFETTQVPVGAATILLSESLDRTLAVLDVGAGTIYLTSRAGAEAGASDTIAVTGRIELPVRGVVYAVAQTNPVPVKVITYSADY